MSPQLREGLREAAHAAGCSLNAFAVQVLAATVGDPARFRDATERPAEVEDVARDHMGYPLELWARWEHIGCRSDFIEAMYAENMTYEQLQPIIRRLDAEEPGYYVEWARLRDAEHEARESGDRRGVA